MRDYWQSDTDGVAIVLADTFAELVLSVVPSVAVVLVGVQVALVDLAYVHLGLNDPVSALGYAVRVLGAQHVSAVNQ